MLEAIGPVMRPALMGICIFMPAVVRMPIELTNASAIAATPARPVALVWLAHNSLCQRIKIMTRAHVRSNVPTCRLPSACFEAMKSRAANSVLRHQH
jgi:hypothetical protein